MAGSPSAGRFWRHGSAWGLLLLLLAWLLPGVAGAQHFPPDEDLELMLRYLVEDGEAPGIVLGVLEADGTARVVAHGSAGPGARPLGPRSVFEIGSLTMTFTATLLADMVARGEVRLEDPVARYLPDHATVPAPAGYAMTLGDLATHRSGLPPGPAGPYTGVTVDDLYALLAASELDGPGRRYAFSHLGYALLGHALARAAGAPYGDILRDRVLHPLGMEMTGYELEDDLAAWAVRGHPGGDAGSRSPVPEAMRGATGLRSNAQDMLRFLRANAGPPGTELERAMRTTHEIRVERGGQRDRDAGYGFSWRTYLVGNRPPILTHGGGAGGATALAHLDPERGIGTVVLANTRSFRDPIARTLLLFDPPRGKGHAQVDPAVLERYVGSYSPHVGMYRARLRRGQYFVRLEDEGYLTYQPRGRVRSRLYAESDSTFYMLRGPYAVTFVRQGDHMRMIIQVDEREPDARGRTWRVWRVDDAAPPPDVVAADLGFWQTRGPGTWALLALLGVLAAVAIARSLQSGRGGTGRVRSRAAWSRPGKYP